MNVVVHIRRNSSLALEDEEKPEISGRVAGTVRRYMPIDTREYTGAILHFYVGDIYESNRWVIPVNLSICLLFKGTSYGVV